MKQNPNSRRAAAASAGVSIVGTPNASSTSAEPHRDVIALFPCLATFAPAAAATSAAAVEILKLPLASPPVPHVSTNAACSAEVSGRVVAASRIAAANPAISAAV